MKEGPGEKFRFVLEWNAFIKKGDMYSLGVLYNNYFDLLYNYGRKFHFENPLIEDAIQNIFLNLIKAQKILVNVNNHYAYLLCSFRNELFHLSSKEKSFCMTEAFPNYIIHSEYNIEEEIIQKESDLNIRKLLFKIVKKLTPSQQEILYLRFNSGFSYGEISKIINISVESCRTSVYRALKTLKKDIESLREKGAVFYF